MRVMLTAGNVDGISKREQWDALMGRFQRLKQLRSSWIRCLRGEVLVHSSGKSAFPSVLWVKASDDAAAFEGLQAGMASETTTLFERHYLACHRSLTLYCLGFLKDKQLAENVASESLFKLWRARGRKEVQDVRTWLFVVAKNACINQLKKNARRREIEQGLNLPWQEGPDGERQLMAEELERAIQDRLDEASYTIWALHQQGYDNREIAARVGKSEKTVANVKTMVRNTLRELLNPR